MTKKERDILLMIVDTQLKILIALEKMIETLKGGK